MSAEEILRKIAEEKPLIHHITNYVTVNLAANVTLSVGALPVMAQDREEVEEMASVASALVINVGTLDPLTVEAMIAAGKSANRHGAPVVVDPVGAGATAFRSRTIERILDELEVAVVCGNAGEISTIAGIEAEVRGVESISGDAKSAVVAAAKSLGTRTVVAATGPTDFVSDGESVLAVEDGHSLMGRIVGSGCASTAVVAAFAAVAGASAENVARALACYGCAGEDAAPLSDGPGTFEPRLLDALASLSASPDGLDERTRIFDVRAGTT